MLHLDGKTVICALGQRANRADVPLSGRFLTFYLVLTLLFSNFALKITY